LKTWIENTASIIFALALFPALYIQATMNALHEDKFPGIWEFKEPFYLVGSICQALLLITFVLVLITRFYLKRRCTLAEKISKASLIVVLSVFVLGFAPCFYDHKDPHTIVNVVSQSLLCPSYSNRSYPILIIFALLSGLTLKLSRYHANKNS